MRATSVLPSVIRSTVVALFLLAIIPASAAAQAPEPGKASHWGVRFTYTPSWEITDQLKNLLFDDEETGTISGSNEFTIGFARGSTLGGDWGVSYVRKPWDDGSGPISTDTQCLTPTNCATLTESTLTQGAYLDGVEVHWTPTFVTIKNRVQVGLNVAGGIGFMKGDVVISETGEEFAFGPGGATKVPVNRSEVVPAKDELLSFFPLFKLEGAVSFIVAPGLKARFAAGANFPAYSWNIGAVYLIGAK
jgi:hypothetical protein